VTTILMSVKPHWAELILSGRKKYELRRMRPSFPEGAKVWLYSTKPVGQIVGSFSVGRMVADAPHDLWPVLGRASCVSEAEFLDYFRGKALGHAIEVERPRRVKSPCPPPAGVGVPQSYRYMRSGADLDLIRDLELEAG